MNSSNNQADIFPKGEPAPAEYFTGNATIRTLLPNGPSLNCQIGNVVFEAGSRNNWHTHPGGQVLIVTDGVGYYQEKGKTIQLIRKGDTIAIPPDVVHWHGASRDHAMTHIAINPNTQKGVVNWLNRVTDEEFNSLG